MRNRLLLCAGLFVFAALLRAAPAAEKNIRVSFTVASGSIWDRGAQKFKQLVEERSGGKIGMEIFPNGTLVSGNDRVELEMVQAGAVDIALKSTIWLTQLDKRFFAVCLPWLFKDDKAAMAFMDGPIGQQLSGDLEKNVDLIPLAWGSGSFFQLYTNKGPITKPADMAGVKIRVPGNEIFVNSWKAIGAVPVSMSFGEVFPALQTGTIDGGTSPIPLIYSSKFYEISKYLCINNFAFEAIGVLAGAPFWSTLSPEEQKLVREAAVDAMKFQRQEAENEDAKLLETMKKAGMNAVVLSPEQLGEFKKLAAPIYAKARTDYGEQFVKSVEDEAAKLNK